MDHIDRHLDEPLPLEELAARASLSPWHFHRLFKACTSEPLHQYIQRLRLEKGARELLLSPASTVTEIALDCGFSSPSTFARAFRAHFGMNARQWRLAPVINPICPIPTAPTPRIPCHRTGPRSWAIEVNGAELEVSLRHQTSRKLAYVRSQGAYTEEKHYGHLLEELGTALTPAGRGEEPGGVTTIFHDHPGITPPERCRISMGVPVGSTGCPHGLNTLTLPAGWQVVCELRLSQRNHWGTPLRALTAYWLPQVGLRLNHFPPHIHFTPPGNTADTEGLVSLHLPISALPRNENRSRNLHPENPIGNVS